MCFAHVSLYLCIFIYIYAYFRRFHINPITHFSKIISQNNSLERLFDNPLEYWPIYISKKPHKSIYQNVFYLGDAFYSFSPTMAIPSSLALEIASSVAL